MEKFELEKGRGYAYYLPYHIAWCTKDRQMVFNNMEWKNTLSDILYGIATEKEFEIQQIDIAEDYVHILISCKPQHYIPDMVKALKGGSAKKVQTRLPDLMQQLKDNHVWDSSYMVVAGNEAVTAEVETYVSNYKRYRNYC